VQDANPYQQRLNRISLSLAKKNDIKVSEEPIDAHAITKAQLKINSLSKPQVKVLDVEC
jgi:hypothetical protein